MHNIDLLSASARPSGAFYLGAPAGLSGPEWPNLAETATAAATTLAASSSTTESGTRDFGAEAVIQPTTAPL
jgi:hypothetical protein